MKQRNWKPLILFSSFGLGLMISFQNCSRAKFATIQETTASSVGATGDSSTPNTNKCPADQVMDLSGKCISSVSIPSSCTLNGQLIGNGSTIRAYQTSTVPAGSQCVYQTRTCQNGILSGSYTNLNCQPLPSQPSTPSNPSTPSTPTTPPTPTPTPTMPPQACYFNGNRIESGQGVLAYLASSGTTCQSEQRVCSNGVLSGSYLYGSCVTQQKPTCNSSEVAEVERTFTRILFTNKYDIAQSCVDAFAPTVEASYPTNTGLYLRFVNTCGNRACIQKGYLSGRVVEINNDSIQLECRTNQISPSVSNSCQQRVAALPKPVDNIDLPDTSIAQACGVSIPSGEDQLINWVYTCGNRACRSQGYSAGRIVEYANGTSKLECTREEILNQLDAGTLMQVVSTNVQAVATSCVDGVNPAVSDSYPSNGSGQAIRFYNTCGRRYCIDQGYASGRVTELSGQNVQLICVH